MESSKQELSNSIIKIYSELYDYIRDGYNKPKYSNKISDYSVKQTNLHICICSIGKDENLYAREFVEYYFLQGIDKIYIYDNNNIEGENFENSIGDYIDNKYVEIIDVRGLSSIQIPIYNHCYRKNMNFFDWIGLLDMDEYLYIENNETRIKIFNSYISNVIYSINYFTLFFIIVYYIFITSKFCFS